MKHQIFDERGNLAHEVSNGQPEREPPVRLQRVVSCVRCRHCGAENGAQVRCKYPRERPPEVVDMTTESGWTMASAAEVCSKYEAANTVGD